MAKFDTHIANVKAHLKSGKSITSWEAITTYGCTRLSAVIFYLKEKYNMNIESKMIYEEDGKKYARYTLFADFEKKEAIKNFLKRGNHITEEVAYQMFDCDELNIVISELRKEGMNIISKRVKPLCGKEFTEFLVK